MTPYGKGEVAGGETGDVVVAMFCIGNQEPFKGNETKHVVTAVGTLHLSHLIFKVTQRLSTHFYR